MSVWVYTICIQAPQKPEENVMSSEVKGKVGWMDAGNQTRGLGTQEMLLTTKPPLIL